MPIVAPPNPAVDGPVRDAIESIESQEQRELLFMYFYERLSYREIARQQGWGSHERVRRGVAKGLDALAEQLVLGGEHEDP